MKILFLDWKCFNKDDTIKALENLGHEVIKFFMEGYNDLRNEEFLLGFTALLDKNKPDVVFSYNYFPILAEGCKETTIPYISLVYDNPYVYLYSYTLAYPNNHIFLFDSSWVKEFNNGGLQNVYYTVLPGNANKINQMDKRYNNISRTKCDISFVGALYNEQHNFYERLEKKASSYLKGYLDGIIEAQQKLYGVSIVESAITPDILSRLKEALPVEDESMSVEPKGYRYSNYFIKRKVTQLERMRLLNLLGDRLGDKYTVKLFTIDPKYTVSGIENMGISPYETEMPFVFNNSRINLNISLRSINTGIPLRCIDIMSCGGFLLSNYQADLVTDFIPGEDFDYFGDPEDMIEKIEYYLSHENERKQIAENGREKIRQYYSFEAVFGRIFDIVFGDNNG